MNTEEFFEKIEEVLQDIKEIVKKHGKLLLIAIATLGAIFLIKKR